ncbi:MAG: hypothetical protein KF742_01690 [Cryobacterium sp.]|nr:hypothetical protein [Cryobacterium sp.]
MASADALPSALEIAHDLLTERAGRLLGGAMWDFIYERRPRKRPFSSFFSQAGAGPTDEESRQHFVASLRALAFEEVAALDDAASLAGEINPRAPSPQGDARTAYVRDCYKRAETQLQRDLGIADDNGDDGVAPERALHAVARQHPPEEAAAQRDEAVVDVGVLKGGVILQKIWNQLLSFVPSPAPHQLDFLRQCIFIFLPMIFSYKAPGLDLTDWERYEKQIRQHAGFSAEEPMPLLGVAGIWPRQFGKTTAVAMFCAAFLAHAEEFSMLVTTTNQRISQMVSAEVWKFLTQVPGIEGRVVKRTQERLIIRPATDGGRWSDRDGAGGERPVAPRGGDSFGNGERGGYDAEGNAPPTSVYEELGMPLHVDHRYLSGPYGLIGAVPSEDDAAVMGKDIAIDKCSSIHILPSGSDRLRGLKAKVVVVDEAAFVNYRMFMDFLLPLMRVQGRRMIIISTPSKSVNSPFSRWINEEDAERGKEGAARAFVRLVIQLMCEACSREKKTECTHKAQVRPPWESAAQSKMAHHLMSLVDVNAANRELRGVAIDGDLEVFKVESVRKVFERTRWWSPERLRVELSVVDPSKPVVFYNISSRASWCPQVIFILIDPSGGGIGSDTAIIALFFTPLSEVVVSICAHAQTRERSWGGYTVRSCVSRLLVPATKATLHGASSPIALRASSPGASSGRKSPNAARTWPASPSRTTAMWDTWAAARLSLYQRLRGAAETPGRASRRVTRREAPR